MDGRPVRVVNKERLQKQLGYYFKDPSLLSLALTHRSIGAKNNERLEFLGDAILGFVVAELLFHKFPEQKEGQLSRIRSQLVKRETLAKVARSLQLGEYLSLGPGELRSGGQNRESILSDSVEAIIAAVYLDSDMATASDFILRILANHIELIQPEMQAKDPKTTLQEKLQARKMPLPHYEVESVSGDQHNQRFKVSCQVETLGIQASGQGSSRRAAEQSAAELLLEKLN